MARINYMPNLQELKTILKSKGLKATPQRLAVHEAMLSLGHASVDMVVDYITQKGGSKVTVASVYNVLSQLALYGIYKHRLSANNKMYFDVNSSKHMHLYDTFNNEFKDVFDDELFEILEEKMKHKRFRGYKIDGIDIQIICHPSHRKMPFSV